MSQLLRSCREMNHCSKPELKVISLQEKVTNFHFENIRFLNTKLLSESS